MEIEANTSSEGYRKYLLFISSSRGYQDVLKMICEENKPITGIKMIDQLVKEASSNSFLLFLRGYAKINTNNPEEAKSDAIKALALNPEEFLCYELLSSYYCDKVEGELSNPKSERSPEFEENLEKGIYWTKEIIKRGKDNVMFWNLTRLSEMYAIQENFQEALKYSELAYRSNPGDYYTAEKIAEMTEKHGDYISAATYYTKALENLKRCLSIEASDEKVQKYTQCSMNYQKKIKDLITRKSESNRFYYSIKIDDCEGIRYLRLKNDRRNIATSKNGEMSFSDSNKKFKPNSQRLNIEKVGKLIYRIQELETGLYLSADQESDGNQDQARVILKSWEDSDAQKWIINCKIEKDDLRVIRLINKGNEFLLSVNSTNGVINQDSHLILMKRQDKFGGFDWVLGYVY